LGDAQKSCRFQETTETTMTPEQIGAIRRALAMSHSEFAQAIGFVGENAATRAREIEDGRRPISGPTSIVLRSLAQAVDIEDDAATADSVARIVPRFLDCSDLEDFDGDGTEIIMHTRYPRFFAVLGAPIPPDLAEQMRAQSVPVLHLPADVGGDSMSFLFIDEPVGDPSRHMAAAVALKTAQARRDLED
jgi:DNA-binding transcriptional regulator YiaG